MALIRVPIALLSFALLILLALAESSAVAQSPPGTDAPPRPSEPAATTPRTGATNPGAAQEVPSGAAAQSLEEYANTAVQVDKTVRLRQWTAFGIGVLLFAVLAAVLFIASSHWVGQATLQGALLLFVPALVVATLCYVVFTPTIAAALSEVPAQALRSVQADPILHGRAEVDLAVTRVLDLKQQADSGGLSLTILWGPVMGTLIAAFGLTGLLWLLTNRKVVRG